MSIYKPKASPFWHFDFQFRGHRFHGSTRCRNRRQAEIVERAEREKAKHTLKASSKGVHYMSIDEAAGRYWTEVGQHHICRKETWTNLERLVIYFGKNKLLNEISDDDVARLVAWRRGHHVGVEKHATNRPRYGQPFYNRSLAKIARLCTTLLEGAVLQRA